MKKYFFVLMTLAPIINAMHYPDPGNKGKKSFKKSIKNLSPLQRAVINDNEEKVKEILKPKFPLTTKEKKNLVKQIADPNYLQDFFYDGQTLLHTAVGKLGFRVLTRRVFDIDYQKSKNRCNFQEVGHYYPKSKVAIVTLLINFLKKAMPITKRVELINQPGKGGFTPMHIAIISTMTYSKNCYSNSNVNEIDHLGVIQALLKAGATINEQIAPKEHIINPPLWFAQEKNFETFFRNHHLPLDVFDLYKQAFVFNRDEKPKEYDNLDVCEDKRKAICDLLETQETSDKL